MKVEVTATHALRRGLPRTSAYCPVALALADAGFVAPHVETSGDALVNAPLDWGTERGRRFLSLPDSVYRFIGRFDAGEIVAPFTFEFDSDYIGKDA